MPVLGGAGISDPAVKAPRAKTWGCLHSTMPESKAAKFRPLMNLDLLPFDGGVGCGPFHNHGTCNCNSAKSHQCPLMSCGLIHAFKKFHLNLDWKGNPVKVAPYTAAGAGAAGAAAPAAAPAGTGADGAKGKGKGKGKGK